MAPTPARSQILLIAPAQSAWAQRFCDQVQSRYELVSVAPEQTPDAGSPETLARGVVVYYEQETDPQKSSWFARIRDCVHLVDLPLVAVTPRPTSAVRAKLMAAGASVVCDAEADPQMVVREVENRCDLEPILETLRSELLGPFIEATVSVMQDMAGTRPRVHSVYRKQGYRIFGDYSAILPIESANGEGTLVMSFPLESSRAISERMLSHLGPLVTDDMVQSCLAELTNIIVGQAKGRLSDSRYHFSMSIPTVVWGPNHEVRYKPGLPCLVASFNGDIGDFALQLCMSV